MSTHTNPDNLVKSFQDLFAPRSEEKEIEHDSYLLMSAFLSEIEAIQEQQNISRKELAKNIKISPSYLTQVFRNDTPLNFATLAKIKRALKIRFQVKALPLYQQSYSIPLSNQLAEAISHPYHTEGYVKSSPKNNMYVIQGTEPVTLKDPLTPSVLSKTA